MGYRSVVVALMSAALLTFGTVGSPDAGAQLLPAPTLTVTHTSGYAGDGVSATGTCPVESGSVEICLWDTSVGSATVDSSTGEFGTTFTVPQIAPGSYGVSTSCDASADFEVLPTRVVVDPTLVLDPTSGYPGDGVSATGTCPVDSGSVQI